jgi:glycosyltransferase involved in cell wall biosynthesis
MSAMTSAAARREAPAEPAAGTRPRVLLVSKPVAPPWNDSGKNLARDLARHGARYSYGVLTVPGFSPEGRHAVGEPIYRDRGRHAPSVWANLRVLRRLLRKDDVALRHFLFAPNPRACAAARVCAALRRVPTVLTVVSFPREDRGLGTLAFGDRVVALSEHGRRRLLAAGVPEPRVRHIAPGVDLGPAPVAQRPFAARARRGLGQEPLVLFAGDYEFSSGAETLARAIPRVLRRHEATFVFACRSKTEKAARAEARVRALLSPPDVAPRVRYEGQVDDILDLVAASTLCVMPSESVYAKSDLPLVLLEALARGVPLVVADVDPLREVLRGGGGVAVPPRSPEALADALAALLADAQRRRALAEEARASAERHFDVAVMAARYEDLYAELLC